MQEEAILKYFNIYKEKVHEYKVNVLDKHNEILSEMGYSRTHEVVSKKEKITEKDLYDIIRDSPFEPFKEMEDVIYLHGQEAYDDFVKSTFNYLYDRHGDNKLKILINTQIFPDKGLNIGFPSVQEFINHSIRATYFSFDEDEFNLKNSDKFISILLDELNPKKIFAFNIHYNSPLFGYDVDKYAGVTHNTDHYNLFKSADKNSWNRKYLSKGIQTNLKRNKPVL